MKVKIYPKRGSCVRLNCEPSCTNDPNRHFKALFAKSKKELIAYSFISSSEKEKKTKTLFGNAFYNEFISYFSDTISSSV